jgi:hypothetical protein
VRPDFAGAALLEVWVPLWIEELGPAAKRIDGVMQFHLAGTDAVRSWYLDFGPSPPIVLEAIHPAPDLTLTIDDDEVMPLLGGQLDVARALQLGTVAIEGDSSLLARWVELFSEQLGGMRTLYASVRRGSEGEGRGGGDEL